MAFHGKPVSKLWSVTCHIGSHSVTCYRWTCLTSTARQAGTRFIYSRGL